MTHFWPDYTALIADLRKQADRILSPPDYWTVKADRQKVLESRVEWRAADALEAERKVRIEEYAIAKHLRAEALAAKDRAEAALNARPRSQLEAIATIAELTSALAGAREALEPFAKEADRYEPDEDDGDEPIWDSTHRLRIKHLRAARAALSRPTTEPAKAEEP